jgi:3-dehydroquinate synthase
MPSYEVKTAHERYEAIVERGITGRAAAFLPSKTGKVFVVSTADVWRHQGPRLEQGLHNVPYELLLLPGGEERKRLSPIEAMAEQMVLRGGDRSSIVVAFGGGIVNDMAGFLAAIFMRGIPVLQVPSTLLGQVDAAIGGKTGVNLAAGKNLVGAFHQPAAVFIDTETLLSLPSRELVSGFCEMVKHGLIAGEDLLEQTVSCLRKVASNREFVLDRDFADLIARNCEFKASIVENDERESTARSDAKSRRILNFGHTTAHALEAITKYRVFRHGEAVGYGMLVAGELSRELGLLASGDLQSLRTAVALCGRLPRADKLDIDRIIRALQHDKKSVDGQINWVLLEGVGRPKIVDGRLISTKSLRHALRAGLQHAKIH